MPFFNYHGEFTEATQIAPIIPDVIGYRVILRHEQLILPQRISGLSERQNIRFTEI